MWFLDDDDNGAEGFAFGVVLWLTLKLFVILSVIAFFAYIVILIVGGTVVAGFVLAVISSVQAIIEVVRSDREYVKQRYKDKKILCRMCNNSLFNTFAEFTVSSWEIHTERITDVYLSDVNLLFRIIGIVSMVLGFPFLIVFQLLYLIVVGLITPIHYIRRYKAQKAKGTATN